MARTGPQSILLTSRLATVLLGVVVAQSVEGLQIPNVSGEQPARTSPRSPELPPADVSGEVSLTITAEKRQYEQLEPVKIRLKLINNSKVTYTFEDASDCLIFGYEIVDLASGNLVDSATSYGKLSPSKPGRGRVKVEAGKSIEFSGCPNLCIDMTVPTSYSIAATMKLKTSTGDRPYVARSKILLVEVVPLSFSRQSPKKPANNAIWLLYGLLTF